LIIFLPIFKGIWKKLVTWSLTNNLSCQVISFSSHGSGLNGSQQPVRRTGDCPSEASREGGQPVRRTGDCPSEASREGGQPVRRTGDSSDFIV